MSFHSFIHQWLYSPLLGPGLFFSSVIFLHRWKDSLEEWSARHKTATYTQCDVSSSLPVCDVSWYPFLPMRAHPCHLPFPSPFSWPNQPYDLPAWKALPWISGHQTNRLFLLSASSWGQVSADTWKFCIANSAIYFVSRYFVSLTYYSYFLLFNLIYSILDSIALLYSLPPTAFPHYSVSLRPNDVAFCTQVLLLRSNRKRSPGLPVLPRC
jgi:hypothetical protein